MRITYFINYYPKVTHSFIRREIQALEGLGIDVQRIALRGWDSELVDFSDAQEREKTKFVLKVGVIRILLRVLFTLITSPLKFFSALGLAFKMGLHAEKSLPFHLVYLAEACQIVPWMKAFGSSHVHAHFGSNSAEVVMLANVLGGPKFSFTVHGPEEFDKQFLMGLQEKIRRSSFVVAVSSFGKSQLMRILEHDSWSKVHVVHCGLEHSFHEISPIPILNNARLICVGRLSKQKGQLLLLEAMHNLAKQRVEFELVLAGDGEMRPIVEQLITKYDLKDKVHITGWISSSRVRDELLNSCCMVLPSFAEGLPVVIMEALALRRPVISTYVAGIPELIVPNINGWLVPAGSVVALMAAIEDMLSKTSEQLAVMGEAGYTRVLQRHDIVTEVQKLFELFQM